MGSRENLPALTCPTALSFSHPTHSHTAAWIVAFFSFNSSRWRSFQLGYKQHPQPFKWLQIFPLCGWSIIYVTSPVIIDSKLFLSQGLQDNFVFACLHTHTSTGYILAMGLIAESKLTHFSFCCLFVFLRHSHFVTQARVLDHGSLKPLPSGVKWFPYFNFLHGWDHRCVPLWPDNFFFP